MFITSGRNPNALKANSRDMSWPGPRMLLLEAQSGFDRAWIETAEQSYLVFEFAETPASRFDALRAAIIRGAQGRIGFRGPLLYCENAISGDELDRLRDAVKKDEWLIEHIMDPADGKLTRLVLGARIVSNPSFLKFFSNLNEGVTEARTGDSIDAIDTHLVWRKGATQT